MSKPLTNFHESPRPVQLESSRRRVPVLSRLLRPRLNAASGLALALAITLAAAAGAAMAQQNPYHSNPWLLSWIPATCCVTNDCCWEISEREVRPLADDNWEIVSTGQVRKRTDWSPDGKFYRCACDFGEGKWIKHQGAFTRCLFVPLRSASR
jgi:hypothetical protein